MTKKSQTPETTRPPFRILISFHAWRNRDLDALFGPITQRFDLDVFADSGAFSAWTIGAPIQVEEYAAWLKRWSHWFAAAANLDVISTLPTAGFLEGHRNFQWLQDQGLHPIPVFHAGEPQDRLYEYIETYPYIALGGLVGAKPRNRGMLRFFVNAFKYAQNHSPNTCFHMFGLTDWRIAHLYPWFSTDSTTWIAPARFGDIKVFDPVTGIMMAGKSRNIMRAGKKKVNIFLRWMARHNIDLASTVDRSKQSSYDLCYMGALAYLEAEAWVRAKRPTMPVPAPYTGHAGPKVYMVHSATTYFSEHMRAVERLCEEGTIHV